MLHTGQHAEVATLHSRVTLPGVFLLAVSGAGLVGLSRHAWSFDQSWIGIGLLTWMVLVAVQLALVRPGVASGHASRVAAAIGDSHGLPLIAVSVMVFKPGL